MDAAQLRDRFRGTILGTALGDALGAPFEGHAVVDPADLTAWETASAPLRWTDDTAMTLAVGESLVDRGGFDGAHMAQQLAETWAQDPDRGYGAGPPQVFRALLDGAAWDAPARTLFGGEGSHGNGAAMRAAPVGLACLPAPIHTAALARQTAAITHTHELGVLGAALQATAVNRLVADRSTDAASLAETLLNDLRPLATGTPYDEQLDRVAALPPSPHPQRVAAAVGNGVAAVQSVPAALAAFLGTPRSFRDTVRCAVLTGGDTDTIAAMAGALSGAHLGASRLPVTWQLRLEDAPRLHRLADRLLQQALHTALSPVGRSPSADQRIPAR